MRLNSRTSTLLADSSSPMKLFSESGNTRRSSSMHQVKSWKPCFNFAKGNCRYGATCRYSHDANARSVGATGGDFLTRRVLHRCDITGDLYHVRAPSPIPHAFLVSQHTWHQRLGHPGSDVLCRLVSNNVISCNKDKPFVLCHACQLGKYMRLPFVSSNNIVSSCFDIVHSDVWTSPIPSLSVFESNHHFYTYNCTRQSFPWNPFTAEFTSEYSIPEGLHPEFPGPEEAIVDLTEGKVMPRIPPRDTVHHREVTTRLCQRRLALNNYRGVEQKIKFKTKWPMKSLQQEMHQRHEGKCTAQSIEEGHDAFRPAQSTHGGKSLASIGLDAGSLLSTLAAQDPSTATKSVSDPEPLSYANLLLHLEKDIAHLPMERLPRSSPKMLPPRRLTSSSPWGVSNQEGLPLSPPWPGRRAERLCQIQNFTAFCLKSGLRFVSRPIAFCLNQMYNNIMAAGSRDRPPMLATGRYPQWRSRFLRYINTRPNGDALRKCILNGPYIPTTVVVQAVAATDDSSAIPEHTTRTVNVAGARENVGSPVVQQSGIQCFNCKEFGHFAKECRKPKRVKNFAYHKKKMLLCKQAEKGVPLQAEQYDWLADTDEEINGQELEAHYSYMTKIQEVPTADSCTDSEPLEQVQNDTGYNVFANDLQHSEQSESISNTCIVETDDSNFIPDSPDTCDDDIHNDQNDVECDDERVALANLIVNLKLDDDENKKIQKQLNKANKALAQELKECKTILTKTSKTLGESNSVRDSCLIEFEKYKAFNDRTIIYDKLE
nr:ribonuclease H-like domain-containing protein [Tanacetum cinerariifolium]